MDGTHREIEGLPTPGRGAHPDARSRACVMEYAALLAGDRHSDRPASVHPLLVQLCQATNDWLSDDARRDLVRLVPALIGTGLSTSEQDLAGRVLAGIARSVGAEAEVAALVAEAVPARERPLPRTDPGGGGGTAVLDRPVDETRHVAPWRRPDPLGRAGAVVYARYTFLLATRGSDQEVVDVLEAMVHAAREVLGRPEVSTARAWPHDVIGELERP